jgi:hypothetical protein
MRTFWIAVALAYGLAFGPLAAAKLPAPPAMSEADKAAKAAKDAASKAHDAELLGKAQDRAVANYKKGHGMGEAQPAAASGSKKK